MAETKVVNKPCVVHCKKETYDVYIGRPSKWGNPFTHLPKERTRATYITATREGAIEAYRGWIHEIQQKELFDAIRKELYGKVLGCWCTPLPCHGDILLELAKDRRHGERRIKQTESSVGQRCQCDRRMEVPKCS